MYNYVRSQRFYPLYHLLERVIICRPWLFLCAVHSVTLGIYCILARFFALSVPSFSSILSVCAWFNDILTKTLTVLVLIRLVTDIPSVILLAIENRFNICCTKSQALTGFYRNFWHWIYDRNPGKERKLWSHTLYAGLIEDFWKLF